MRLHSVFLLPILCVSLLVAPVYAGASSESLDGVTSSWPMDLIGAGEVAAQPEAFRFQPSGSLQTARLQAETVEIDFAWEKGVHLAGEPTGAQYVSDHGQETVTLKQADLRFERFQDEPLFLAYPDEDHTGDRPLGLTFTSATGYTLTSAHDVDLAQIGTSPDTVQASDTATLGFWYTLEGPVAKGVGEGAMRMEGDFSLFVHDVVVEAKGGDKEWSQWTGYKESDHDRPVKGFEFRLTKIHVRNGTFVAASEEPMEIYAPSMEARFDGVVHSPGVTGRLPRDDETFRFDQDPLRIEGEGEMQVDTVDKKRLRYRFSGDFEVHGADGVDTAPTKPQPLVLFSLGGLALAALTTMGLARVGVIPAPTAASRERRYERYMQRGLEAIDGNDAPLASWYYERATRVKRHDALAWYNWAHAELVAGNGQKADEIAVIAARAPGMDQTDILDLRASAALDREDWPAFEEHLTQLALANPDMARGLVRDLEVDRSRLGGQVREIIGAIEPEDDLYGYA